MSAEKIEGATDTRAPLSSLARQRGDDRPAAWPYIVRKIWEPPRSVICTSVLIRSRQCDEDDDGVDVDSHV